MSINIKNHLKINEFNDKSFENFNEFSSESVIGVIGGVLLSITLLPLLILLITLTPHWIKQYSKSRKSAKDLSNYIKNDKYIISELKLFQQDLHNIGKIINSYKDVSKCEKDLTEFFTLQTNDKDLKINSSVKFNINKQYNSINIEEDKNPSSLIYHMLYDGYEKSNKLSSIYVGYVTVYIDYDNKNKEGTKSKISIEKLTNNYENIIIKNESKILSILKKNFPKINSIKPLNLTNKEGYLIDYEYNMYIPLSKDYTPLITKINKKIEEIEKL